MTLEVSLLPTVAADLVELEENIRDIDKLECEVILGLSVKKALQLSTAMSYETLTGRVNGDLVAVFGIASVNILTTEATPWLLATNNIDKYIFAFTRNNKKIIAKWKKRHSIMRNYIHVDNKITIRWLRWLGFDIQPPKPYGVKGELFHQFELRSI